MKKLLKGAAALFILICFSVSNSSIAAAKMTVTDPDDPGVYFEMNGKESITSKSGHTYDLNYGMSDMYVSFDDSFTKDPSFRSSLNSIWEELVPDGYTYDKAVTAADETQKPGTIITIAGGGTNEGDGYAATSTLLDRPVGVAVDEEGNFYIIDNFYNKIRKVDTKGIITTIVDGYDCPTGIDQNPWSHDSFEDIAFDKSGNLYIADVGDHTIKKMDLDGNITTIAGNDTIDFNGDGGLATEASLYWPSSVDIDINGNVYIADTLHNRIRKVDKDGIITTVAGNGEGSFGGDGGMAASASLNNPNGVAVDKNGNLYIADTGNGRIRKVDTEGIITTISGDQSTIMSLSDIDIDSSGNIYFIGDNEISELNTKGSIITVAGNGSAGFSWDGCSAVLAGLSSPSDIAVDKNGDIYIADNNNNRIRKVSAVPQPEHEIPAVPDYFCVTSGGTAASLSWEAVVDASYYNVYYKKQNGKYSILTTENTSIDFTDLSTSSVYFFKVTAVNPAGEGNATTEVSVTTTPSAPKGLSVSISGTTATLTWKAVAGATSYKIYYKKGNGRYKVLTTKTNKIKISKLSSSQKYYFKVSAVNTVGEGSASSVISRTTPSAH